MRFFWVALAFAVVGCSSEEPEGPGTLNEKQCVEGGKAYKPGAKWACSDGCNQCSCTTEGLVESTTMACDTMPPFMVDTAMGTDTKTATDTAVSDAVTDG
jgi:hypothetical protein